MVVEGRLARLRWHDGFVRNTYTCPTPPPLVYTLPRRLISPRPREAPCRPPAAVLSRSARQRPAVFPCAPRGTGCKSQRPAGPLLKSDAVQAWDAAFPRGCGCFSGGGNGRPGWRSTPRAPLENRSCVRPSIPHFGLQQPLRGFATTLLEVLGRRPAAPALLYGCPPGGDVA